MRMAEDIFEGVEVGDEERVEAEDVDVEDTVPGAPVAT